MRMTSLRMQAVMATSGFFSGSAQAQIKLFEDAVMPDSAQHRHVKRGAHRPTTAINPANSVLRSAVAVVRCNVRQRGSGLSGQLSEFGHFGQHRGPARSGKRPLAGQTF